MHIFNSIFVINVSVAFSLFAGILLSFLLLLIDIPCLASFGPPLETDISRTDNRVLTVHLWSHLEKPHEGYILLAGAPMMSPLLSEIKDSVPCSSSASSQATTLTRTKCRGHSLIFSILIGERKWCHSSAL